MKRRDTLKWLTGCSAALALPARAVPARIVLGQSAAISGPAAELGLQLGAGARLYFNAVNAQGGVNGATLELRTLDDGYEPDRCLANTERLLRDDVFALFGFVGTPTCLAALPPILSAKVPFVGPFTGAQALREPLQPAVFHVRASYDQETALIVRQLTALGLKKIAVFYQNDAYGQSGLAGVRQALHAQGLEPVALGTVERNSVDVARAVADIAPHAPDAVVQVSAYKSCAAFIRAARKAGFGGMFFNLSFVGTQALSDELGKEARGIIVSQVMPSPFSTTSPIAREYLATLQLAGGTQRPNYSSMEGYVAAKVLVEGLRRAGRNPSREALVSALESIQNASFGGFQVDFGPKSHVASHFVELSMLTEDGKVRH